MPDALEPRVAAETLLGAFRSQAENLRPFDPAMQDDLAFWRDRLADLPPLLEIPTDRPRSASRIGRGGFVGRRPA